MLANTAIHDSTPDPVGMIGRQLGSFRLVRHLGTGGMGSVYLARHAVIGSRVAIKVLHPALNCDERMFQRFQDEARAVNLIGHENILSVYDLRREGELHYLVMEYLEGKPLSGVGMPMEAEAAIPLLAQLCDALSAAHARGVIHRDVKPENVMLVPRRSGPFVKLLDFGVAKLLQDATPRTAPGFVVGTPGYMAPESFRGEPLDGRADLYAVGVLSYLLAVGELPFRDRSIAALMRAHLEAVPVPPSTRRPGVDPRWSEITLRAMAKRPEARYQDARALRDDLLLVLGRPSAAPAPARPTPTPRPVRPSLEVEVVAEDGSSLRTAAGMELSMEGMFLAATDFAPPLFSPLRLILRAPGGGVLRMDAEVVRPVNATQAAAWGMSEGVGVQFTRVTEEQRRGLSSLAIGAPLPVDTPLEIAAGGAPDPEQVLAPLRRRVREAKADPYRLLEVAPDADAFTIRRNARELRRALQGCRPPRATPEQQGEAEALLDRIARAAQTLVDPPRRAELDAARGNVAGVERAIAEGLTMTELEALHRRFLRDYPHEATHAALEAAAGRSYERAGDLRAAAASYERALRHDPLDQGLRRRLQALRRQGPERAAEQVTAR